MGSDIHNCAIILGERNLVLLYLSNLMGSTLSWIACLIVMITYLVKKYKQRQYNNKNPHHICVEAYQYFNTSQLNQINGITTGGSNSSTLSTPNTTPISIPKSSSSSKNKKINNNNNKNAEKEPLLNNSLKVNGYSPNHIYNNESPTSSITSSTSTSSYSSNNSSANYSQTNVNNIDKSSIGSSTASMLSGKSNYSNNGSTAIVPIKLKCGPHCLVYSELPAHVKIREQKTNPKKIDTLIFYLSISDFIAVTAIILSQIIVISKSSISDTLGFCIVERASIHFGLLATLFWSNCIAYYLLRETYELRPYKFTFNIFHLICWGTALFGASSLFFSKTISIAKLNDGNGNGSDRSWCSVSSSYQLYFWVLPLFISFTWNLICYILIYKKFNQILSFGIYGNKLSYQLKKHIFRKLSFYLLAFLITWIWDVVNNAIFIYNERCPPFALWMCQEFFSSATGFLNFIVYVATNKFFTTSKPPNRN